MNAPVTGRTTGRTAQELRDRAGALAEGEPRTWDNSTPVFLDGSGTAVLVTSGEVDIFAVPLDPRGNRGRRLFVGSTAAGSLLLGAEPIHVEDRSWHLLAVGVGAEVLPLTPRWADHLADSDVLQEGLHRWVTDVGESLTADDGARVALSPVDSELAVEDGQVLAASADLIWIAASVPVVGLLGTHPDPDLPIPCGAAWCLSADDAGLIDVLGSDQVTPDQVVRGVAWWQQMLLTVHSRRAAALSLNEQRRERRRRRTDQQARSAAVARLSAIDAGESWQGAAGGDPLVTACQVLGRVTGIPIVKPANWSVRQTQDPVRAIARASGVRVRTVTLGDEWWRDGLDVILAFTEAGAPVVLAPETRGDYRVIDPATGSSRRADSESAARLRPSGYVFYRPLPPGSLSVRSLLRYGLNHGGRDVVRLLAFSVIAGLLSLAIPIATGTLLGSVVPQGDPGSVYLVGVLLLLVVLATTGFLLARSGALLRLQGRMLSTMQAGLWDRLIALPAQFFGRYSVADLTMRANGVDAIQQIVASIASQTLLSIVTLTFSLVLLFAYSPTLAGVVVLVTLSAIGIGAVLTWVQIKRLRAMYDAKGASSGTLLQIVQGIDKIRAAAAESRALNAWAVRFAPQAANLLSSERLSAFRTAMYAALPAVLNLIVFAAVASDPELMTTAAFLSFITALGQVAAATSQLDLSLGFALNIVPLFDRMRPILEEPEEVSPGAADPGRLSGRVEMVDVSYGYPGTDTLVLHDVNIRVEPGEFVALVGPSGSGKSTIVRLLLGFDRPDSGTVAFDGKDLTTLDVRGVRSQIGVALQNASVTGSDILSAIVGGWPLSEDDAWAAADKVGLGDDIRAMPMGMRTILGDNAATFSGGQRQRLVLAAAIARNPRLVILDEATSALDSVTQAQVAASFDALQVSRLVVAHRLSTIRHADRIIVLDGGRIVQEGTYDDLAGRPGIFGNMVERQTL